MPNVTFDGDNRVIQVSTGVTALDVQTDLFSEAKRWALGLSPYTESHAQYLFPFFAIGGQSLGGGKTAGQTFFITNGWRIRPDPVDHELTINGSLYRDPDDATVGLIVAIPAKTVAVAINRSVEGVGISTGGGTSDGFTTSDRNTLTTISTRTARVNALVENVGGDRFTPKALEAAPTGGSGSGLTAEQVWTHEPRTITARPPGTASDTVVAAIKAKTDNLPQSPASTDDVQVQVTVDGGFTTGDRTVITTIATQVDQLHELEGIDDPTSAKDPVAGIPGYRRTATIRQTLTQNPDGSYTIAPEPAP